MSANNILKRADGTIEVELNDMKLITGYKTFEEYYKEYVTRNSDNYDIETVKFE